MASFFIILIIVSIAAVYWAKRANSARRVRYIENYSFHKVISSKLTRTYPQLTEQERELVLRGLRDYFLICLQAKRKWVSMPSQVVDEAWHQFILSTRLYDIFCQRGFGYFLHHTPAETMAAPTLATDGIKRAWRLACAHERIDPKQPTQLPLIFALDAMLNIPGGFTYVLQCDQDAAAGHDSGVYCASHIGCSSGCAGDSGSDSVDASDSSDSSGCSSDGGCGGGGCGGGGD